MASVLISGASTGIGRATALRLARGGWTVLAGVRDRGAGEALRAELDGQAQRLIPLALDVTDSEQVAAAAQAVEQHTGGEGLAALVNNAGIAVAGPLELLEPEEWRRQLEVNVIGTVALTRAMVPALRRAGGRIAIVSSVGGRVATPYLGPYCASKHALEAIADSLRVELHRSGVGVTLIEPGAVATPIWDKGRADADGFEVPAALSEQYGHVPGALRAAIDDSERRGIPPERVAETIERVLTARRAPSRRLVGLDARVQVLLRAALPDRAFDGFVRRFLSL